MIAHYYNENSNFCVQWLRNLIAAGYLPAGDVDDRDIRNVRPGDLAGYTSAHWFAGIGLWAHALRMAEWPDDRPVWTGSCPCQGFSQAGKGLGFADERHLWPAWFPLIRERRPVALIGEQVASPAALAWLDLVHDDMEGIGYAVGAVDLPSAGVGAPNIRQRLWWVADRFRMADTNSTRRQQITQGRGRGIDGDGAVADRGGEDTGQPALAGEAAGGRLGDTSDPRLPDAESPDLRGAGRQGEGRATEQPDGAPDPWRSAEWVACLDGKRRPFEPGSFPLAARHPGDVAKLRAYGNAINPYVAAEVIRAWMECSP